MTPYRPFLVCLLVCSLAGGGTGCTSMKTVPPVTKPGGPTFGQVQAGETVVVHTRDGRRVRFVVEQVDGDVIVAPDGVRYARAEIAKLERRSFSGPRTALLVGGIVAGAFLLILAAAAAALSGWQ